MHTDPPIERTASAYAYPLLIKQLLHTPLAVAPDQEIVYRDLKRYRYRELRNRIGRLAGALAGVGIGGGDTVAVMDWDSHRYLESYFAVPMMGAVLMTVNVRLSPEQIVYTLNHCGAKAVLVNAEFLPVLESIRGQLEVAGSSYCSMTTARGACLQASRANTSRCWRPHHRTSSFSISTRTRGPRRSTPPVQRARPRVCISVIGNWSCTRSARWGRSPARQPKGASTVTTCTCPSRPCSMCMLGACRTSPR